ncbi:nucleotide exchange factor GrpE [Qipengyuania atrilutea]|uniref:Protein GrpE n=1 Tax=Qipengyuania atrilutea TaxID=2744473 RepID=A0A850H9P8_9SPHN|nr:nucleotide exchange factor GrpE [Actirhodobacter atriluteus]NVD43799.1 nucleotide exchange factor GrpE [Actirhodobacter atriluteus]
MIDDGKPRDEAAEKELEGVPEEFLNNGEDEAEDETEEGSESEAIASLRSDLEAAKQDVLYAKAETQNVRRRMEKDVADARNYAATGFARDILSVSDNLDRAIASIPEELRSDEKMKGFVTGIEATQRELAKVFLQNGITRIAAMGLPLDPNQHQAMLEIPTNDEEPGTVVQEMQPGYMIKDRLLRPAMVGVARKPD